MEQIEKDIKQALANELAGVVGPERPTPSTLRRIRARKAFLVAGSLSVTLLVGGGIYAATLVGANVETVNPGPVRPASAPNEADEPTKASQINPVDPPVKIASGAEGGNAWSLEAYVGQLPNGERSLCMKWEIADSSNGFDCFGGLQQGPGGDDYTASIRYTAAGSTALFGIAKVAVDEIDIELKDGGMNAARIYNAPGPVADAGDFFVGFAPPGEDVALVARNGSGSVVEREPTQE